MLGSRKDFIVTPNYLAKILQINRSRNVDLSLYDDRLGPIDSILETFEANLEISSMGTHPLAPEGSLLMSRPLH